MYRCTASRVVGSGCKARAPHLLLGSGGTQESLGRERPSSLDAARGLQELQRDSTCSLAPAGVPCLRGDRVYSCCSPRLCQDPARLLPLNTSLHSVLSHAKRWVPPLPHITEWGTAVRGLAQGPQLYCQPIVPSTGAGGLDDPSTQKASHPLGLHLHWTHLSDLTCSFQVLGVIVRPLPSVAERLLQSL